jgi:membrane protein DedA with SNARE-associated domain
MMVLGTILVLILGTLGSEDLTCVTAGQLAARGEIRWTVAVAGCFIGIYLGDLGLWLLGRILGRRVLTVRWVARNLPLTRLDQLGDWFDRNAAGAILASRFLPGTRVPLYVAAGTLGHSGGRFARWTLVAAAIWTPAVVLLAALFGDRFTRGGGWITLAVAVIATFILLRTLTLLLTEIGRARLIARVSLLWRWEFWPMVVFYPPVALWVAWLSLRHRSFATITAANPGIPHGGFVGESKFQILSSLKSEHVITTVLIDGVDAYPRLAQLDEAVDRHELTYPLVLKPDVGQRGAGVKLVRSREEASRYLASTRSGVIAQPYHGGPFEAGIFYFRIPGHGRGRIFSITDKHFARVTGNGVSTLRELIWRDPRYRMQAATFLKRHEHELDRVLALGEAFRLVVAGNHCQGTLFRDGAHLLTPRLERAIDRVARTFDGFHFGRFDVRYADVDRFRAGEDFTIIELNGITSESTNIYDPSRSLPGAYRMLFRQWSILFQIGSMNCRAGHRPSRLRELVRDVVAYYRAPRPAALSD